MKKNLLYSICVLLFVACEDVIEVDTPAEPPRLIINALIRIDENSTELFFIPEIRVSLTSSFFEEVPATGLEQVTITNVSQETGNVFVFNEREPGEPEWEPGLYVDTLGISSLTNGELVLQVTHEGQIYLARTSYVPAVPIDNLAQGDATLFDGDETEVAVTFTDVPDRNDYYLFDFDFGEYLVTEDEFYQGQQFVFSYFYDRDLQPGQEITISLLGVDEPFYNYMNQLIEQSGDNFGPFATPAATVRGNFINGTVIDNDDVFDNVDDPNNFALGYFAVVQEFKSTIIIEDL